MTETEKLYSTEVIDLCKSEKQRKQNFFNGMKSTLRKAESVFEVSLLSLVYYFIWRYLYDMPTMHSYYGNGKYLLTAIYAFLLFILFVLCDGFKFGHVKLTDVVISQWLSGIIVNIITYFQLCLIANQMISFFPILLLTGIDIIIISFLSYLYTRIYHKFYVPKNIIMIYGQDNAISLKQKMDTRNDKYMITKMISCNHFSYEYITNELLNYDAVVINDVEAKIRNDLLKYCYRNSIRTYLVPKLSDIIYSGGEDITLFDTPLKLIKGGELTPAQKFVKRTFDLTLSLIAMIPAVLIMVVVAAAIKIEDGGSVFYRQKRVTKDGKVFDILKFRSMIENAESDGTPHPATTDDDRITKVGKVIRAIRIDELPQLLNIIKGDMSIVGPRPERVEHCEKYGADISEFAFRNKVEGGLTGYAQIYGKYNTTALDKLRLDLMYIENYSLMLDIKLILMTLRIMLKKESTEGFVLPEEKNEATVIETEKTKEEVFQ